jgi:hypothetical protein
MKIHACLLAGSLALTPVAWADNCPALITQIDEILASKPDLDEETIVDEDLNKSVKQLRDEGEKLHKQGKHKESVEILEKAIGLLSEETG